MDFDIFDIDAEGLGIALALGEEIADENKAIDALTQEYEEEKDRDLE